MRYDRDRAYTDLTKQAVLEHKREERHTARMIAIAKPILNKFNETYLHPFAANVKDGRVVIGIYGMSVGLRTEDNGCYYSSYSRQVSLTFALTLTMKCFGAGLLATCHSYLDPNWPDDEVARQIERDITAKRADLILDRMRSRYQRFQAHLKRSELVSTDQLEPDMWLIKSGTGWHGGDTLWHVISVSASRAKIMVQPCNPDTTSCGEPERMTKDAWSYASWHAVPLTEVKSYLAVHARHEATIKRLQEQSKG